MGGGANYWRETGVRGCEGLELVRDILPFMSRTSSGSSKGPNGRLAGGAPPPMICSACKCLLALLISVK